MANEKSIEKFKWKPGQSGNPSGRPKKRPITEAYEKLADEPLPQSWRERLEKAGFTVPKNATFAYALALGQYGKAIAGDSTNAREIREAQEGRATQRIELSGVEGGAPIQVQKINLKKLSKEELLIYRDLIAKAAGRVAGGN
jgi:hypothetical protein